LLAATISVTAGLTSCTGTAGVEVSKDWSGITDYTVADVNGLATVVGIDTRRDQARSMIVVPDQDADSDVLGPVVSRRGSRTLVARPTKQDTSQVYRVVTGDPAVSRVGTTSGTVPLMAAAGGWVELTTDSEGSRAQVLGPRLEPVGGPVSLEPSIRAAATDGGTTLCVTYGDGRTTRAAVADLAAGHVSAPVDVTDLGEVAVGCWRGRTLVVGAADPTARPKLVTGGSVVALRVPADAIDAVQVIGDTAAVAVVVGSTAQVRFFDLTTGGLVRSATIAGMDTVIDLFPSGAGHENLIAVGEDDVAVVNRRTGAVSSFPLPGRSRP
jgi:hypothetical protein